MPVVAVVCPACGQDQPTPLRAGFHRWREQTFDLVRCGGCGLAYLSQRPRRATYAALLESDEFFASGYSDGTREQGYFERRDDWIDTYDRELEALESQIEYVGRLVQWGAGGGFFGEAARRRGWQVQIAESNRVAADYAEVQFPLPVHRGTWEEAPYEPASFDLGVLHGTLPYSLDPKADLAGMYRLIRPGGHLWLCVPTFLNSALHRGLDRFQRWLPKRVLGADLWRTLKVEAQESFGPPYRLQHFHPTSVENLLAETGWQVERVQGRATRPDYLFARRNLSWRERCVKGLAQGAGALMQARVVPPAETCWLARRPLR